MALGAVLAPAALVAIPAGLTFDLAGATAPPCFPVTVAPVSAAAPPFPISVGDGSVVVVAALFGRAVGVVVAMSPFLPDPTAPLLLGGAPASTVVVVAVTLAAVAAVAPPPLLAIVVPAAAAVMGVVPTAPTFSALPVPFAVPVMPPVGVAIVPTPFAGGRSLLLACTAAAA